VNARTQRIDDQLRDTNQNSTNTLISNSQDLLPVADDNDIDVLRVAPLIDVVLDTVHVLDVQETALGAAEEGRVVLDGVAFGGGVDDGEHLFEVVEDELESDQSGPMRQIRLCADFVVQDLILLLHARHERVFGQIIWAGAVLGVGALDLLVERLHVGGNKPMQLELGALFFGEG
jgi:hypothetical protein